MSYFMRNNKGAKRGDIFYIANSKFYSTDPENEAGRPGIVVSCDELNENAECVEVVYLTTKQKKPMPTHTQVSCVKFLPQLYAKPSTQYRKTGSETSFVPVLTRKWQGLKRLCPIPSVSSLFLMSHKRILLRILPQSLLKEIFTRTSTNNYLTRWCQRNARAFSVT